MKRQIDHRLIIDLSVLPVLVIGLMIFSGCEVESKKETDQRGKEEFPAEWFYQQRAFPFETINEEVYRASVAQVGKRMESNTRTGTEEWQLAGPINIGGRITDIVLHPTDQGIVYAGSANGGVFKTEDGGKSWEHIFAKGGKLAVGDLAMAPSDPEVIYLGTGEANGSASSGAFFGDGMYRSDNGGDTWEHIGLSESHHIGRIVVDPDDEDRVYVAATGTLYGKNEERGIFRSVDGGEQWERILFVSDSVSAIDIAMDMRHPDTLYAAMWERLRRQEERDYAGLASGIHRSFDGGDTWERLTNGLPMHEEVGRIGLTVASDGTVYATFAEDAITNDFAGLFKSNDAGNSWTQVDDGSFQFENNYSGFGWYFGNVRTDPKDPERVFIPGLRTWESTDGGVNWERRTGFSVHVDHHALEVHPQDPDFIVLGTDGGIYYTKSGGGFDGNGWTHIELLGVTEFYTCAYDPQNSHRLYGGAQDNGTLRTLTGADNDWEQIFGGDGFYVIVDPLDTNVIYCEYQWGRFQKSTDGGDEWEEMMQGIDNQDRTNWNTPIVMSPVNNKRLYYGSYRLYTTDNAAETWTAISDDLTNTDPASPGGKDYGALSTIGLTPADSNVIYTGSEDGHVFVTFDHGDNWKRISDDLPTRYITRVAVDPYDVLTAYVTLSGFRDLEYLPHIFRTVDGGETWLDISGDLPEVPLNDVIIDPDLPSTLYVASDLGVWYTNDLGISWFPLGTGLPMTAYMDLDFVPETRTLIAASFGLSMFTIELGEPVSAAETTERVISDLTISPNPISYVLNINFTLSKSEKLLIELFAMNGKKVETIGSGIYSEGNHQVALSRSNILAGVYVVTLSANNSQVSRLAVLK